MAIRAFTYMSLIYLYEYSSYIIYTYATHNDFERRARALRNNLYLLLHDILLIQDIPCNAHASFQKEHGVHRLTS